MCCRCLEIHQKLGKNWNYKLIFIYASGYMFLTVTSFFLLKGDKLSIKQKLL